MRKWAKRLLAGIAAAAAVPLLVYASGWLLSFRQSGNAELPAEVVLQLPEPAEVGAAITGKLEFSLPLHRSVERAVLQPGDGSLAVGPLRVERIAWRFTRFQWRVSFELCAGREGQVKPGTLSMILSGNPPERIAVPVPGFSAVLPPPQPGTELELAGALPIPRKPAGFWWIGGGSAVLLAAVIGLLLWRRHRCRREISLPDRTLALLSALELAWNAGRISPESAVAQLTDLVRSYLDERFGIRVSTRTTPEFLADLDRDDSLLKETEKQFLREFLEAADRVKFAALPLSGGRFEQALANARNLVEATRPAEGAPSPRPLP